MATGAAVVQKIRCLEFTLCVAARGWGCLYFCSGYHAYSFWLFSPVNHYRKRGALRGGYIDCSRNYSVLINWRVTVEAARGYGFIFDRLVFFPHLVSFFSGLLIQFNQFQPTNSTLSILASRFRSLISAFCSLLLIL